MHPNVFPQGCFARSKFVLRELAAKKLVSKPRAVGVDDVSFAVVRDFTNLAGLDGEQLMGHIGGVLQRDLFPVRVCALLFALKLTDYVSRVQLTAVDGSHLGCST